MNKEGIQNAVDDYNQFRTNTALHYTPDADFQGGVGHAAGQMGGETIRNIAGYAIAPFAGTPTLNEVMSQQIPYFQDHGLNFTQAYDQAWWNGPTDLRNILNLPVADKFSKGYDIARTAGRNLRKDIDDDVANAFIRYGRDINPKSLIKTRVDELKNTPLAQNIAALQRNAVNRAREGLHKIDEAVTGGSAAEIMNRHSSLGKKIFNEVPSTVMEDSVSTYEENSRHQEIGEDVSAFDNILPDEETINKSAVDAVVDDEEIYKWFRGYWK